MITAVIMLRFQLDSYSVFYDNGQYGETYLRQILHDNDVTMLYLTGLATDYCVYWSAKDALQLGMVWIWNFSYLI